MNDLPRVRACPEDFVVDELPAYSAAGEGAHLFVHVEKRLRTTEEVAAALAEAAGIPSRDVGYAGRKDRLAVARQWLSVEGLAPEAALALQIPGVRILEAVRHVHKLRTGHLRGNRFVLRVRSVTEVVAERAADRLVELVARGMPNRFGAQRYGRDDGNVRRGRSILLGRARGRDRRAARFAISALQSAVFDHVLAQRPLPLDAVERGDVARVETSGGLFVVEDETAEGERAARFEISATGPIFGTKVTSPTGAVADREAAAHVAFGLPEPDAIRSPRGIRLRGTRRPLRVRPEDARLEVEGDAVVLHCTLPPGSYATVLLSETFGELVEGPLTAPDAT